jgi:hypothetical protein
LLAYDFKINHDLFPQLPSQFAIIHILTGTAVTLWACIQGTFLRDFACNTLANVGKLTKYFLIFLKPVHKQKSKSFLTSSSCRLRKYVSTNLHTYILVHAYIYMHFPHWFYSPLGPWPLIFQFHENFADGRAPLTSDQLVARPLAKHSTTQAHNRHTYQTSMPCVGFELTIPASDRAKTVHTLDRSTTLTGKYDIHTYNSNRFIINNLSPSPDFRFLETSL